jgi:hypothetical protein
MTIHIDGPKRQVFIKTNQAKTVEVLIQRTHWESTFEHDTGEISNVIISPAGLRRRNVRIANLRPEMPADNIRQNMINYGAVTAVQLEKWSNI